MKKYHWGMIAVVLAVGFSAFRTKNQTSQATHFILLVLLRFNYKMKLNGVTFQVI
jgi:hypothetical protein